MTEPCNTDPALGQIAFGSTFAKDLASSLPPAAPLGMIAFDQLSPEEQVEVIRAQQQVGRVVFNRPQKLTEAELALIAREMQKPQNLVVVPKSEVQLLREQVESTRTELDGVRTQRDELAGWREAIEHSVELYNARMADLTKRNLELLDQVAKLSEKTESCCNTDYREKYMALQAEHGRLIRAFEALRFRKGVCDADVKLQPPE